MAETNTQLLHRAYAAFSSGDLRTLAELISPDCVWIVGGDNALSGSYHGRDATFDYFGKLMAVTSGTFKITVLAINEVAEDTCLVAAHVNATSPTATYDEEIIQQFHMRHGQAVATRTFVENGHIWDRLVGPRTVTLPRQTANAGAAV